MLHKKRISIYIISFIAGTLIMGCNNDSKQKQSSNNEIISMPQAQENEMDDLLCFRNEYPYHENSSRKDVVELKLTIDNDKVSGIFNWLPAEKDKREGNLTGTIKKNIIETEYIFLQEGITDTAFLKIILEDKKAVITGGKPELGLNISIEKVDCD